MRRGTRVGQAYVALAVDGGHLDKDIADEFDDVDYKKIGREKGGEFAEGWSNEERARIIEGTKRLLEEREKEFSDSLGRSARSFENDDRITQGVRHQLAKAFDEGELSHIFDRVGTLLGERAGGKFQSTMKASVLDSLEKIQQEAVRGRGRGIEGLFASPGDSGVSLPTPEFDKIVSDAKRALEMADREYTQWWEKELTKQENFEKKRVQAYEKNMALLKRTQDKVERDLLAGRNKTTAAAVVSRNRETDASGPIAAFFGKGARNNFFNLFGNVLGSVAKAADVGGNRLAMMATEGSKLQAVLQGAGPEIVAVVIALSAMVSVIGALIGLVTALASAVATALVGSLLVAAPLIAAVTAGLGLMVVALTSLTDAQRKAFLPLKEAFTGLGQIVLSGLSESTKGFTTWRDNLLQSIGLILPYAKQLGAAFGEAGNNLTKSFSGRGFKAFADTLGAYLPAIVNNLSTGLGSFLNGLLGMFSAVMPYVVQFSAYLADVSARFDKWANSAKGQNSIADFMGRAAESIKSVWGFLRELGGLLKDVLFSPEAQAAGNTIFDAMSAKISHWRDIVSEAAKNGDLQKWFAEAIDFGGQLWAIIEALGGTFIALYNSGVLKATADALSVLAGVINALNVLITPLIDLIGLALPAAIGNILGPIGPVLKGLDTLGAKLEDVGNKAKIIAAFQKGLSSIGDFSFDSLNPSVGGSSKKNGGASDIEKIIKQLQVSMNKAKKNAKNLPSLDSLLGIGKNALSQTSKKYGGLAPNTPEYVNPYKKFAESLIKDTDSVAASIKKALTNMSKKITDAIRDAAKSTDVSALRDSLLGTAEDIKATAQQTVDSAQQALNSAAESLAGASSKSAAEKALKKVHDAQRDLEAALKNQKKIDSIAKYLAARQRSTSESRVQRLIKGLGDQNATLADYAVARARVATKLEAANTKLADAISLRDQFKASVIQSTQEFGSLLTTQGQILGGIEQAITATDITTNLQDRLDKIRKFQADLRVLTAQGLSAAAYKQIVDAGVEQGSQFTQALLNGGITAVQQTNSLVSQIQSASNSLGLEASNRMYQAGVDAAQGLVDGLTSLSAQLDSAAARLGGTIATALRRALGIHSPSRVMFDQMGYVGDGLVDGLDAQHSKVSAASEALSKQIAVSPEVANYAAKMGQPATVSGNQAPIIGELTVHTPTEDPMAVAHEVINEVTGRLT